MPEICYRLREVREALGLSQQVLVEFCGITARSQRNYESCEFLLVAFYLSVIAAAGADVLYILTGQRAGGAAAPPPPRAVSEGDRILLDNFHAAPAQVQAGVKTTLGAFADASAQVKGRKRAA